MPPDATGLTQGGENRTVLVVDDDGAQRDGLAELLSCRGYDVVLACDGQAARELLQDGLRPTLIVLDLVMPRMNGWVFLGLLRGTDHSTVPVLVVSGEAMARTPEGADARLEKPLDAEVFGSVVGRLFAACARREEGRAVVERPPGAVR